MSETVFVPLDVPKRVRPTYVRNYKTITHKTGRLMLFAGDQKVEHLNDDFHGEKIHPDDNDPEHLFRIASKGKIGVFATQLGLIARYGADYPEIPYLVKLNSKSHLVKTEQMDPMSTALYSVQQIVDFRDRSGLNITSVGYTIYVGSEKEPEMLRQAAQIIYEAHQHGLVTVLWIYPRGKAVKDEKDPHLIAGAAGVASALGSDFVKVNAPKKEGAVSSELMQEATKAAGRTKVVCAGGSSVSEEAFLQQLYDQIHVGGTAGNATGRNIHQKSLDEAVRMCDAIYAVTVEGATVEEAVGICKGTSPAA
jgi:fructose-bisphosphate aldolase / 6-deoxy-5-ketofructose 1-phosphate synthase